MMVFNKTLIGQILIFLFVEQVMAADFLLVEAPKTNVKIYRTMLRMRRLWKIQINIVRE